MIINEALNCVTSRRIERRFLPSVRAASENVNRKRIQDLFVSGSSKGEKHIAWTGGKGEGEKEEPNILQIGHFSSGVTCTSRGRERGEGRKSRVGMTFPSAFF